MNPLPRSAISVCLWLLAALLGNACAAPRLATTAGEAPAPTRVAALAPLDGQAATCSTLTVAPERRAEGIAHLVQVSTSGAAARRVRVGFDSVGRPVVLTAVAQARVPGEAAGTVDYVELQFDAAGAVRRGQHARGTEDAPEGAPHGARPLAPADSVDGPALARAVRERCAR